MNNSGYAIGSGAGSAQSADPVAKTTGYWPISKCKKAYLDYLNNKVAEIEEAKNARRYYHSSQWTQKQIDALNKRKQPVVTFNRIGRKIDGVVGLIERLRQDPKAYPRTPQHEEGAELATAAIRYVLDEQEWKAKSPEVARDGAIEGIGGVELELTEGDKGDAEVSFDIVEPDSFFYDPRSYRADFTDASYMGLAKWLDLDKAIELAEKMGADEEKIEHLKAGANDGQGTEFTTNPDRENKWFSQTGGRQLVRLVDIWYQHKGQWCWAIFTGSMVLMEGESYLKDEKNKGFCKYIMYSGNVDHDGDRYGFVRNMKSAQDEYNSRRSRALFTANSRRLLLSQGAVADVEAARREWARPDGVVVVAANNVNEGAKADDQNFDFAGQLKLMENAIQELENYGPNQALVGDMSNQSGRAIQLLQQAGMAELGPYILQYRGWKVRLYRAIWNAVKQHWTAERWIRVTDDENIPQLIQVNGKGTDPNTGMPALINSLGALDVDIIIDEGPDGINMQADAYDTLTVMASKGANIPPAVLLELAPLQGSVKKKLTEMMQQAAQQPNPEIEKTKIQLEAKGQEKAMELQAKEREGQINLAAKQQESAAQLELDQRKAHSDAELEQQKQIRDLAFKREQAELDRQVELEKMAMQSHHEREKLGYGVQAEREKLSHGVQAEREKRDIQLQIHFDKAEGEKASAVAKTDPGIEKMATAIVKMAESIEDMGEKIAAPKKIIRDGSGKITGAKTVGAS